MSEREENMNTWATRTGKDEGDKPTPTVSDAFNQSSRKATNKTGNEKAAATAAEKLVGLNKSIVMILFAMRMPGTAMGIAGEEDNFYEATYNALLSDPKLCKWINDSGAASGKIGLAVAYAGLMYSVAPTAIAEYKV